MIVSDNFHSCFFIPDLCGCRLCASDMSGLMRLLIYASVGLFSVYDVFSGHFCTFLCSLSALHCARSRSGGVRCVAFYKHDLAFVPFSFFHPLHVGEQSVEYPQGVISIQRTKASGLGPRVPYLSQRRTQRVVLLSSLGTLGCLLFSS